MPSLRCLFAIWHASKAHVVTLAKISQESGPVVSSHRVYEQESIPDLVPLWRLCCFICDVKCFCACKLFAMTEQSSCLPVSKLPRGERLEENPRKMCLVPQTLQQPLVKKQPVNGAPVCSVQSPVTGLAQMPPSKHSQPSSPCSIS